jgi:hypothetical protein
MATDHGWRQSLANRRALLERREALDALDLDDAAPPERRQGPTVREAELEAAVETHRRFVEAKWARQMAVSGRVDTFDADDCPCLRCRERASERARLDRVRDQTAYQAARQAAHDAARGFAPPLEPWEL